MTVLIVRPQTAAGASIARAQQIGLKAVAYSVFNIAALDWTAPDAADYDAVMITSANAVLHGGPVLQSLRHLPVFAVGDVSGEAAAATGFTVAAVGSQDAASLLPLIVAAGHSRILWLAGKDHTSLPSLVDVKVDIIPVYQAVPAEPAFALGDLVEKPVIAVLYSARTAHRFAHICGTNDSIRRDIVIAALSPAIATAVGSGWRDIIVAETVSDVSLLSAVAAYCKELSCDP